MVELVLQVDSAFTLLLSADGHELEVHLIRGVLCHDNGISSTLHVVELTAEDSGEASLYVVCVSRVESELPLVAAVHLLGHIKEENESRDLLFHSIDTSTAHDRNLILGGNSCGALKVESVNLVLGLQLFVSKVHLFLVLFLSADRFYSFKVHGSRFEVELGVSHESEDSLILPVARDSSRNVMTLRDLRDVVPLVADFLISLGLITLGETSVEKAVTVFESTHENVLLLSIALDRDNSGAHAASRHLSDLGARLELHVLVEL